MHIHPHEEQHAGSLSDHRKTATHLCGGFGIEFNRVSDCVIELGSLVQSQIRLSIFALSYLNVGASKLVTEAESEVNGLELEIDREVSRLIVRRQPTASDLRLLMAIYNTTANLKRAADEAAKIARMVCAIHKNSAPRNLPSVELSTVFDLASELLRNALASFARLDTAAALSILTEGDRVGQKFDDFARKLMTYMMENPCSISPCLDLLFVAKALERIGDHAKNIASLVIYVVKGEGERHTSIKNMELVLK